MTRTNGRACADAGPFPAGLPLSSLFPFFLSWEESGTITDAGPGWSGLGVALIGQDWTQWFQMAGNAPASPSAGTGADSAETLTLKGRTLDICLHGPAVRTAQGGTAFLGTPAPQLPPGAEADQPCPMMESIWQCLTESSGVAELLSVLPRSLGEGTKASLVQVFRLGADGLPEAPPAEWWSDAPGMPSQNGLRERLDACRKQRPDTGTYPLEGEGRAVTGQISVAHFPLEPGDAALVLMAHPAGRPSPGAAQLRMLVRILSQFVRRNRVERSWADEVSFSKNVLELMGQGLTVSDHHGNFIFVNSAYLRLAQRSLAELIGSRPDHLAAPEDLPVLADARRLRALGQGNTYEMTIVRPDGSRLPVLVSGVPRLVDGKPAGAIAVTTDLTAYKEAERRMRAALDREQELNLAKNSFMRLATHEYRNPISAITYASELLADRLRQLGPVGDGRLTDRINRHAKIIQDSANQLNQLLDKLQLLWRLQVQDIPFEPKPSDVTRMVEETVRGFGAGGAADRIRVVAGADLPPSFPLDAQVFRVLLRNVIENALIYSPAQLPVTVCLGRREKGGLRVSVQDLGPGVPPEDELNIFNAFYRGANAVGIPGSGVGLANARLAAQLHGGSLRLKPDATEGTVFMIEIPESVPGRCVMAEGI